MLRAVLKTQGLNEYITPVIQKVGADEDPHSCYWKEYPPIGYTCIINNKNKLLLQPWFIFFHSSFVYFNFFLTSFLFSVPPSISGKNEMVTVVVNNPARLECEARGIPFPILTWLKDGSPVSSISNRLLVFYYKC